jgi:hypothetical protein
VASKAKNSDTPKRRSDLVTDRQDMTYEERLIESGSIDLRDNYKLDKLGGGYVRIAPVDPTKRLSSKKK